MSPLDLPRRQQQVGLGVRDALDETNAAEHGVERLKGIGAKLGDDVPAAVGRVQGLDRGIPCQRLEYPFDVVAFDHHRHQRPDAVALGPGLQAHGVARDRPVGLELAHAWKRVQMQFLQKL